MTNLTEQNHWNIILNQAGLRRRKSGQFYVGYEKKDEYINEQDILTYIKSLIYTTNNNIFTLCTQDIDPLVYADFFKTNTQSCLLNMNGRH